MQQGGRGGGKVPQEGTYRGYTNYAVYQGGTIYTNTLYLHILSTLIYLHISSTLIYLHIYIWLYPIIYYQYFIYKWGNISDYMVAFSPGIGAISVDQTQRT